MNNMVDILDCTNQYNVKTNDTKIILKEKNSIYTLKNDNKLMINKIKIDKGIIKDDIDKY